MNALTKAWRQTTASLKALALRWANNSAHWWNYSLGRTRINYQVEVGDGRGNSIVMACVLWICKAFLQAPLRIQAVTGEKPTPIPNHPLLRLIKRPNRFYSGRLLWWATVADWNVTGNAYWIKQRSVLGMPVELWWVPSTLMEPKWPDDGRVFISHYEYTHGHGEPMKIQPDDVVHFRYGMDPLNPRKGMSPLASLLREIFTDDEAASFTGTLLRNMGVPGVIISPRSEEAAVTDTDAEAIKAKFEQTFGGDNRGRTMVMTGPTDVSVLSFSPEQMSLETLRRIPEERVSAVLGVAAIVAGLGAGLDRSTFANFSEAREASYEEAIINIQGFMADELSEQLLPDFGDPDQFMLDFDISNVRILQEDTNALYTRLGLAVAGGFMTVDEAREKIGEQPVPGGKGEVFYVPSKATVTPLAQLGEMPDPAEQQPEDEEAPLRRVAASSNGHHKELVEALSR